jgi:hypothetical protein
LALFIGARAELIVVNSGGAPSLNVQGTLYGMKE